MSWIAPLPAATPFEAVLTHRPQMLNLYRSFIATLSNSDRVPARTLELCRLRVAAIHECRQEWQLRTVDVPLTASELEDLQQGVFARFSAAEQAALAIAEQLPYAHHSVSDADVEHVRAALGEAGAVALLTAIAFFDVNCRIKLTLNIPHSESALEAPSHANALR